MKKYYPFLLLILVFIVYLFLHLTDRNQLKQVSKNQQINKALTTKHKKLKSKHLANSQNDSSVKEKKQAINDDAPIKVDEISYLSAFRNFTDFLLCKSAIEDWQKGELLKMFRQKLKEVKKFGFDGGKKHEEYYLLHFQHCKAYLLDEKETYADGFKRLQETYQNIEPETEQEKQLAEIIVILDELGGLSSQLKAQRIGVSSFSPLEVRKMKEKLMQLYSYIKPIIQVPEKERTAEQNIILDVKYDQIGKIRSILDDSYYKDEDLINKTRTRLRVLRSTLKNTMIQKLPHIKSPDIFALMVMWKDQNYLTEQLRPIFDEIIENIKGNLTYAKDNYPRYLARASLPLFACALDYPCGSDSQLMTYYCVIRPIYKACGKNVEDFILDEYISPNIRTDVEDFLNLLFENYAQD